MDIRGDLVDHRFQGLPLEIPGQGTTSPLLPRLQSDIYPRWGPEAESDGGRYIVRYPP